MSTIGKTQLGKMLAVGGFFAYGSSHVRAMLQEGHPLSNGFSGTCKWNGKVSDHLLHTVIPANELAMCYGGGNLARLPRAGERILLDVLPSCTAIVDVCPQYSVAGVDHRYLRADTGAVGNFVSDLSTTPPTAAPVSVCEDSAPAGVPVAAFPAMDLYIGRLNSPSAAPGNAGAFQSILARGGADNASRPELSMIGDTGDTGDQWVLWGVLSANVPANSYAVVNTLIHKGGRF